MLWSDDQPPGPPDDIRRAQTKLRRAMLVIALAAVLVMAIATWRA
ncbi:hypothetical protein OG552_22935 [Streptomyces sp. NBC_01476]|nr:hypothetical protein [Streptomyces sp. NBC_01476]